MYVGRPRPLGLSDILIRALPAVALALSVASVLSGCGVRQFGANLSGPQTASGLLGFGPFYSSGQGPGTMSASSCAPGPGHHPCARVRASIGMPYQFDVNPNSIQGAITSGVSYGAPGTPYAGIAGAGMTKASSNMPRMENRDLHLMQSQTTQPAQSF